MRNLIVLPMTFYVFYIWGLAVLTFRTRQKAIRGKEMSFKYFLAYTGSATDRVTVVGRHFDNQFQLPVVYLICCLAHLAVGQVNSTTLILAWAFILTRVIHSYIHLGKNHILQRASAYTLGWIVNLLLWAQLLYFAMSAD
jgi:hypothetical protein